MIMTIMVEASHTFAIFSMRLQYNC